MKTRNILILSALGLCLALGMFWLLGGLNTPVAAAPRLQATGACCACNGQCVLDVTEAWCTDVAHGVYQSDGSKTCSFCGTICRQVLEEWATEDAPSPTLEESAQCSDPRNP